MKYAIEHTGRKAMGRVREIQKLGVQVSLNMRIDGFIRI
jgi:hypothetical protein